MSITVSCECGKQFTVADQLAGKRGKCKACGRVITIPAAAAPEAVDMDLDLAAPEPEAPRRLNPRSAAQFYVPSSRPSQSTATAPKAAPGRPAGIPATASVYNPKREKPQSAMRTIPLPPPIITFLIIAAAITGLTVYWAKNGPIKATHEWAAIRPTADANIPQQITRSIRWIYARHGILTKYPTGLGKCQAIIFDEPVFMFSMPNDIHIWGNSTEGRWIGEFYPKTGKYEVTINILGGKHTVSGQYDDYPMQVDNVAVDDKLMIPPPDPND